MFKITKYDSGDTYARHLIVKLGKFKADFSIVALEDEGCDNKLGRAILSWGDNNRLFEAGITRDHYMLINQTFYTTHWYPTAKTYAWSWAGREGSPVDV